MFVDALRPRAPRIRLIDADERPMTQRLLATLFVPAAERVLTLGRVDLRAHQLDLARRLARPTIRRVHGAGSGDGLSVIHRDLVRVVRRRLRAADRLGAAIVPVMLGLAVFGWPCPIAPSPMPSAIAKSS